MRSTDRAVLILLLSSAFAPVTRAQLVGPIPPPPTPAPEYVPPPPNPATVPTPENEDPAPSIIERDDQGRLKPIAGTPDDAAVARFPFDEARREKVRRSTEARQLDLDRFVITNLDKVLAARRLAPQVRSAGEFSTLFQAKDVLAALKFERLADRLLRDGAITMQQRTRLDETVREHDIARKKQIDQDTGSDPTRTAILNLRQTFDDTTLEPFASLDRQVADFMAHAPAALEKITLRPDQLAAAADVRAAASSNPDALPEAVRAAVSRFFFETLDLEQQRAVLSARLADRARPAAP